MFLHLCYCTSWLVTLYELLVIMFTCIHTCKIYFVARTYCWGHAITPFISLHTKCLCFWLCVIFICLCGSFWFHSFCGFYFILFYLFLEDETKVHKLFKNHIYQPLNSQKSDCWVFHLSFRFVFDKIVFSNDQLIPFILIALYQLIANDFATYNDLNFLLLVVLAFVTQISFFFC